MSSLETWLIQEMLLVNIFDFCTFFFDFSFSSVPKKRQHNDGIMEPEFGDLKETKFGDLLEEPLGSVPSIIFWSDQQVKLRRNITNMKHTLLTGDYGTGEH